MNKAKEQLRRRAMELLQRLEEDKCSTIAVTGDGVLPEEIEAFLEGLSIADYSFDRYRAKKDYHIETIIIDDKYLGADELQPSINLWRRLEQCRNWVNTPVQDLNAPLFAAQIEEAAKEVEGVKCTVMDRRQIESLRMGGLLAVNRGSVDEPRFVVLEYNGMQGEKHHEGKEDKPIVLVGKGITYDTGGLNIKPDEHMQEMKSDMAGAATMVATLLAAADNRLPVHIMAVIPMTDNRPGFNAYVADDILTMYDGTTVEVVNTDAEGRLILADAIAYAAQNLNPALIVSTATLTGAAVRALHSFAIPVMQQEAQKYFSLLQIVGEQTYERVVELPMWEEYDKLIESHYADLRNCGTTNNAGTITAAKFLAHFAHGKPFIHIDIAAVAYLSDKQFYYRPGATASPVRLLYAFLQLQEAI